MASNPLPSQNVVYEQLTQDGAYLIRVTINADALRRLANRARHNATRRAVDGPVVAQALVPRAAR